MTKKKKEFPKKEQPITRADDYSIPHFYAGVRSGCGDQQFDFNHPLLAELHRTGKEYRRPYLCFSAGKRQFGSGFE